MFIGQAIHVLICARCAFAWPSAVTDYRYLLGNFSKDPSLWATSARNLRQWMQDHDDDYPIYHLTAPEGWSNDPNGVAYDEDTGLYHRFFQYDKTWGDECRHDNFAVCDKAWTNPAARVWGHTVSRDLTFWEDWPGIDADSPWDRGGVWSGNCVFNDAREVVCIFSGVQNVPCDVGVCATSKDWIHWSKAACMNHAPSIASEVNHDTSIWRDGPDGKWYLLIGGCTYAGGDDPAPGVNCQGNAQLWSSADLRNFTYEHPLTPGGPGNYWELPYLLPFTEAGEAIDNYHQNESKISALLFGFGNSYWVGHYNQSSRRFAPLDASKSAPIGKNSSLSSLPLEWPMARQRGDSNYLYYLFDPHAPDSEGLGNSTRPLLEWPMPRQSDGGYYYSFNPHATDSKGPGNSTRRLMFGWVTGDVSAAVREGKVPYWQGAHSILRLITVRGPSIIQLPAPEIQQLRRAHFHMERTVIRGAGSGLVTQIRGDTLEILASFRSRATATPTVVASPLPPPSSSSSSALAAKFSFGLALRVGAGFGGFNVTIAPGNGHPAIGVGARGIADWDASLLPAAHDTINIHVFLDRSIIEVFCGGAAYTSRSMLPSNVTSSMANGVILWSMGGDAELVSLDAWSLRSMWRPVQARTEDFEIVV